MVQTHKKIALLHRYPSNQIKETNAAFPYLVEKGIDVLTFKKFERQSHWKKFFKSMAWIFYAPFLVIGKGYDILYLDDSYPFYPVFIKLASWRSKVVIRLGDLHLMYYYSGWVYEFLHFFEEIGWSLADEIIVISEAMKERLRKEGYHSEVVPDPVELKDFSFRPSCVNGSVMFHGVLTKNKNVDILIRAAFRMPETDFVIVGDGPDLKRLMSIAPKNVHFQGWVPFKEIPTHISTCAVGVALRSDNPGNDYVVTSPFLQYGIMGKPCLVTRRQVFGDYEWQFSGIDEMVEKIKVLMTKPEEGEKLKKFLIENHSAKKIAEDIWRILLSV